MNLEALAANPLIGLLAFVGGAGLVYRLARALLRVGLNLAEKSALDGLVEVSIRTGDLTTMAERQAQARFIRRTRVRSVAKLLFWLALFAVPLFAGVAKLVFAAASVLWLVPREPIRPTLLKMPPTQGTSPERLS